MDARQTGASRAIGVTSCKNVNIHRRQIADAPPPPPPSGAIFPRRCSHVLFAFSANRVYSSNALVETPFVVCTQEVQYFPIFGLDQVSARPIIEYTGVTRGTVPFFVQPFCLKGQALQLRNQANINHRIDRLLQC